MHPVEILLAVIHLKRTQNFPKIVRISVFIVNSEHISHLVLMFLLLTLSR